MNVLSLADPITFTFIQFPVSIFSFSFDFDSKRKKKKNGNEKGAVFLYRCANGLNGFRSLESEIIKKLVNGYRFSVKKRREREREREKYPRETGEKNGREEI